MNANALRGNDNMTNITGSGEMLRRVIDSSPDCVKILDLDARLVWMSEMGRRSMQLEESQNIVGAAWLDFWKGEDRVRAEAAVASAVAGGTGRFSGFCPTAKGVPRWWDVIVTTMFDGNGQPEQLLSVSRDITEQRKVDSQLAHAINHDAVTGLPHHLLFEGVLASRLEDESAPVWIFFVGLDRFQTINESMGHVIGDEVLRQVAERLCGALGEADEIARFAGDEFIIAVTALDQSSAMILAAQLRAAIAPVIEIGDYRLLLTASIGISHSPDHGRTGQDLLRRAEAAMTRAKRQGRDCTCEFSVEQMLDIEDRLVLGSHLRGAIQRGELALHYQPQHHAASRALSGFEALLRWNSQALGPVPPGRFIPVAEALGLMPEIGAWVLNEACRQASIWMDHGHRGFNIAVNVAAPQLQRPGLVGEIRDALVRNAVPAEVLSIELTESALMENVVRVCGTLVELKAMGIKLSLDDFGTGYSSLAYLKQFPIDKLKIDQSFVRGLPDDGDDAVIARTIVAMAHQLRMAVAAEGVETEAQALYLRAIGCDELQGYLLGRPVPAEEAEAFFPGVALSGSTHAGKPVPMTV